MNDSGFRETDNPVLTGILGRCPRCQQGHLFKGVLTLAPRCEVCGLDYSFADPADGPAFFAMTIAAVPALAFALWMQFTFDPPVWVHVFTTLPVTLVACLLLLRPLKGWLVCSQYFHKAEEGRIDRETGRGSAGDSSRPD
ncbi:uncharacterized protein (DUF983 family) [Mesorhizobium sp. J18]|uniref:DUF983 domain-containing protein n=1 Tax=Mesorhizobium sp. J18 TaxID=935263 RepID=UPI00119C86D2|nr:DUF983 domain-containing protein [Mesorhizobium sp. J18]TWG94761.1 uncharacterized protein (DUF983 family) [Mesorhizobium sp. J18]